MRRHAKASTAGSTQRQASGLGRFFRGALATRASSLSANGSGAPSGSRRLVPVAVLAATLALTSLALTSVALAAEPCSNDALRTGPSAQLPDCRAYEQVSPVDKNGGSVGGIVGRTAASVNGDGIVYESHSWIVGDGGGAQEWGRWLAARGAGGWATQNVMPPETLAENGKVIGWTPDLSAVFDEATDFKTLSRQLLLRSSSDGSLTAMLPVAPLAATLNYVGASEDGSKVLFTANRPLIPSVTGNKRHLYAWDRASGELTLAGVRPDGSIPVDGAVPGAYDWAETKTPGAIYNQAQNATSLDGSAFFTADAIPQVYLRLNPTAPETTLDDGEGNCIPHVELACTIHISGSQKNNGAGVGGSDPSGPQPAAFMGASPDGSKVFFTSSEELTNDANTGPGAAIGRANLDGSSPNNTFIPAGGSGIAVNGTHVYWANPKQNAIGRANLDGTGANPAFIAGAKAPQAVALDGSFIYWTNAANGVNGQGTIGRANLDGSSPNQSFITGANNPQGIAVNATHVYWANVGTTAATRKLGRANIDGTGVNQALTANSTTVAATSPGVALDGSFVYWVNGNSIARANLDGTGAGTNFIPGGSAPVGLAINASHVYWANSGSAAIGRANLDGTSPSQSFLPTPINPRGIALNGTHVHWLSESGGQGKDLYVYDIPSDMLADVSVDADDVNGAEVRGFLGASDDGSYAYFVANGVLTNVPNGEGESATPGTCKGTFVTETGFCNLYLAHNGAFTYIARLDANGTGPPEDDAGNWTPAQGIADQGRYQKTSRVSADGQTLLFQSRRQLTGYDNEGPTCLMSGIGGLDPELVPGECTELYLYRDGTPGPICISCNPSGAAPTGPAELSRFRYPLNNGSGAPAAVLARNLSADGEQVFFQTTDALVANDTNGASGCPMQGTKFSTNRICVDVYEWEAEGSGSCESDSQNGGCLYLISSGKSPEASLFLDASASGDDVFFKTIDSLVGQDEDLLVDIYTARAGGGLTSQNEAAPVPCEGEACKPGTTPPPASQSAGSSIFSGPGNVDVRKPKPRCAKGKRKVRRNGKVRCVRKARQKRSKPSIRRTHADRRAHR